MRLTDEGDLILTGDAIESAPNAPVDDYIVYGSFDGSLDLVRPDGSVVSPEPGYVATLRPGEGKFWGAVAVEEGTTNLIPPSRRFFEGWTKYHGADVSVVQGYSIPGITPDLGTRVTASGGTDQLKYYVTVGSVTMSVPGALSLWVHNIGDTEIIIGGNTLRVGQAGSVFPGETKLISIGKTTQSIGSRQLQLRASSPSLGFDVVVFNPQLEDKAFPTSYTPVSRNSGNLFYPQEIWSEEAGTFAVWAKGHVNTEGDRHVTMQWAKGQHGASSRFGITLKSSGKVTASFASKDTLSTAETYDDGNWHLYTVTWVNNTRDVHLYMDGELKASASSILTIDNTEGRFEGTIPLGLSGYSYKNEYFNGLFSDLLITGNAMTEEEVKKLYNTTLLRKFKNGDIGMKGEIIENSPLVSGSELKLDKQGRLHISGELIEVENG